MIQIIYRSTQARPLSMSDLQGILDKSRIKNAQLGITGVLFYDGSDFIQVLEGGEGEVQYLYGALLSDPRHRDVTLLSQMVVEHREFGNWAMAFAHPQALGACDDDLLDYNEDLVDFDMTASRARQFLYLFVEGMLKAAPSGDSSSSFTVHLEQGADTAPMVTAESTRSYLVELGRTLSLAMPEVSISVTTNESGDVQFNSRGQLEEGAIELF
ncbi:MAG: BLUF domain-containing protein [Bacteroidales bacterium]